MLEEPKNGLENTCLDFLNVELNTQKTLSLTSKGTGSSFLLQSILRTLQHVSAVQECILLLWAVAWPKPMH